jgi:hypothetical protein
VLGDGIGQRTTSLDNNEIVDPARAVSNRAPDGIAPDRHTLNSSGLKVSLCFASIAALTLSTVTADS